MVIHFCIQSLFFQYSFIPNHIFCSLSHTLKFLIAYNLLFVFLNIQYGLPYNKVEGRISLHTTIFIYLGIYSLQENTIYSLLFNHSFHVLKFFIHFFHLINILSNSFICFRFSSFIYNLQLPIFCR